MGKIKKECAGPIYKKGDAEGGGDDTDATDPVATGTKIDDE